MRADYESVNRFLRHHSHKVGSEKTRENICFALKGLCEFAKGSPDELANRTPEQVSEIVQDYVDSLVHKGYSTRYVNVARAKVNFFPDRGYPTDDSRKRQLMDMVKVLGFSEDKIKRIEEALAKYEHVDEAVDEIKKLSLGSSMENTQTLDGERRTGASSFRKKEVKIVKGEKQLMQLMEDDWALVKELSESPVCVNKTV